MNQLQTPTLPIGTIVQIQAKGDYHLCGGTIKKIMEQGKPEEYYSVELPDGQTRLAFGKHEVTDFNAAQNKQSVTHAKNPDALRMARLKHEAEALGSSLK